MKRKEEEIMCRPQKGNCAIEESLQSQVASSGN